jgi:hypothetical protein
LEFRWANKPNGSAVINVLLRMDFEREIEAKMDEKIRIE